MGVPLHLHLTTTAHLATGVIPGSCPRPPPPGHHHVIVQAQFSRHHPCPSPPSYRELHNSCPLGPRILTLFIISSEVEFVHAVTAGDSVNFFVIFFSIFTHFLCFFLLKLLKLGEIDGVKFLA